MDILEKIIDILCNQLDLDKEQVTEDSEIIEDLGADSLDIVDLVMTLEEEFDTEITDEMIEAAGGNGTSRGTGGMRTKLEAAKFAGDHGIETIIMSGDNPKKIFDLFDGHTVGTHIKVK